MRAVDTNVLARLVLQDDEAQLAAVEALLATGEIFLLPLTVLLELAWVLRTEGLRPRQIASAIRQLRDVGSFVVDDPAAVDHAVALVAAGVDVADALHVASAFGADAVVTFDGDFVKRAKKAKSAVAVELL